MLTHYRTYVAQSKIKLLLSPRRRPCMWPVWYNAPINVKPQVHRRHGLSFSHHQLAWEFLPYTGINGLACSCTAQLNQTLHSVICDLQACHVAIRLTAQIYMYQEVFAPSLSLLRQCSHSGQLQYTWTFFMKYSNTII